MTVACVLRSGGRYDARWVRRLRDGVAEHLSLPHRFVCLSDTEVEGVDTVPLVEDWPGWWAKIELFRPDVFSGRVLFFDLDTEIVGSLDDLAGYDGPFAMLEDPLRDGGRCSGVMAWEAGRGRDIWSQFTPGAMASHRGDQDWIAGSVDRVDLLPRLYPGQMVSWRHHCGDGVPDGARVVYFHGEPKQDTLGWL